jgi:hypothetical protein
MSQGQRQSQRWSFHVPDVRPYQLRRTNRYDYPLLNPGIYEGTVLRTGTRISAVGNHPYKVLLVRLDNGRTLWSIQPRGRYHYDYNDLRVTVVVKHRLTPFIDDKRRRTITMLDSTLYLGKWDDHGAY